MTLSTTTVRATVPGSGSAGPFSFAFKIFAATDLLVQKTSVAGVVSVLNYPTDYTVTGVGNASGGTLTLTIALATGETLAVLRAVPDTQPTSFRSLGTFFPASHEDEFDRVTMLIQQHADGIKRSARLASTVDPANISMELTPATGTVLGWASATQLTNVTLDSSAVALPGQSRTVPTLSAYLANNARFNVLDYAPIGYVAGVTDAAPMINTAIAVAQVAGGGEVFLPLGTYNTLSGIIIPANSNVSLVGEGWGSIIRPVGTFDALTVGDTLSDTTTSTRIENFLIDGSAGCTGYGFRCNRQHSIRVRNIRVQFMTGSGIYNYRSYASHWENVYSNNNSVDGLQISELADLSVFIGFFSLANHNSNYHFLNGDSSGCRFIGCDLGEGAVVGPSFLVETGANVMESLLLIGCYSENNTGNVMSIAPASGGAAQVRNFTVIGHHFNSGTGDSTANAVLLDNVAATTFIGCKFNVCKVLKTANTGTVQIDQGNQWGDVADCPRVTVAEANGHLVRRSVDVGHVDIGTDADWEVDFLQNDIRVWAMLPGIGSLVPVNGGARGNPQLGSLSTPIAGGWFGSVATKNQYVSANTTLAIGDGFTQVDASGGARTITLPDPTLCEGMEFVVTKGDSSANTVTVNGTGGYQMNGASTVVLTTQYQTKRFKSVGAAFAPNGWVAY